MNHFSISPRVASTFDRWGNFDSFPSYVKWLMIGVPLGALLFVGLWLRLGYVYTVGVHVDEFTSLWAARRILETGLPLMPSGVLYTRGIPSTYVTAAFLAIGGETYIVGRWASVLFGMAAIVVIALVGRAGWNARVGWLAALGLVLLPDAITWSGRARFYAPFLLLTVLTLWSEYRAIQSDRRPQTEGEPSQRAYLLFALLFALSIAVHEEMVLLYPLAILCIVLWRGWAYLFKRPVFIALAICGVAILLRFGLEVLGQPGYFDSMQDQKPYLALGGDIAAGLQTYLVILSRNARKYWTIAFVFGTCIAVVALARKRWRIAQTDQQTQATLFYVLQFLGVLVMMLTVVGAQWLHSRTILFVLPCWLLVGATGPVWIIDRVTARPALRWLLTGFVTIGIIWTMWPSAVNVLEQDSNGYEYAFAYVREQNQEDDVTMSPLPPACAWVMDEPCDYYARERGYQAYTIMQDGGLVDRYTGSNLLSSPEQLQAVVTAAPRVWFVTDARRWVSRYNDEFIRTVVEQFEQVYRYEDTVVLLAEGWQTPQQYTHAEALATPIPVGPLDLVNWESTEAVRGQELALLLFWQANSEIREQINTSLQVVAEDGARIAQDDGPPGRGIISTAELENVALPDDKRLWLPPELPDGLYRLELVAYNAVTHDTVADSVLLTWFRLGPEPDAPTIPLETTWDGKIGLVGHDGLPAQVAPGGVLSLRLVWQAISPIDVDYTAFVHLVDAQGNLVSQQDKEPKSGFYPTSHWEPGQPIEDNYSLSIPDSALAGEYRVLVGWYDPESGQRLLVSDGSDSLELGRLHIE